MDTTWLKNWLENRFYQYHIEREPRHGKCGVVWIMRTNQPEITPKAFALKMVDVDKITPQPDKNRDLESLFKRELRLWLQIPPHPHVLPALGLEVAVPPDTLGTIHKSIPLVRMPFCEENLGDWIPIAQSIRLVDRLWVIAALCNGLRWLYKNGVQGHGDLKPDNILLRDIRNHFHFDGSNQPSLPWQARVSDLGWANIWLDFGTTTRGWKPYHAPERFQEKFIPVASDMFAVGIIATELLTGNHPAGDVTSKLDKKWNKKRWEKWAHTPKHQLDQISPPELRAQIERCLSVQPELRPTPDELIDTLCKIIEKEIKEPVSKLLDCMNKQAEGNALSTGSIWALGEMARLGDDELSKSIADAEKAHEENESCTTARSAAIWLDSGRMLWRLLLLRRASSDQQKATSTARKVLDFINRNFNTLDLKNEFYPGLINLEPQEIMIDFGQEALDLLSKDRNSNDVEITALRQSFLERLDAWTEIQLQQFLSDPESRKNSWARYHKFQQEFKSLFPSASNKD